MNRIWVGIIGGFFSCILSISSSFAFQSHSAVSCVGFPNSSSADMIAWNLALEAGGSYSLTQVYSGLTYIHERPFRRKTVVATDLSCDFLSFGIHCTNPTTRIFLEQESGKYTYSLKIEKANSDANPTNQFFRDLECDL